MRKILSLFMMALFSASMFAADPVEIAKATFNGKNATYTEGWTTTGTGVSRTDCIIIGKDENITSPSIDLSAYDSISITFTGRRYGSLSGSKATVKATYGSTELGTIDITASSVGNVSGNIGYKISGALSTSTFVFTCTNATSAGSSHGAGIGSITITGVEKTSGGDDPEAPTSKTVYCKVAQDWWTTDNAAVGIYAFKGEEKNAAWPGVRMTLAENETNVWTATVDLTKYEKIIFTRVNGSGDISDWGAKTADLVLADAGENDLYTVTSTTAVWGDPGVTGEWSKYVAPTPAEDITFYLINNQEWENPTAHVFVGGSSEAAWPGKAMTKTDDKVNGFDVYSYTFKDNYTSIIFNDGAATGTIQTIDLAWDKTKPYFVPSAKNNDGKFEGTWYASKEDIPAPAVPLEGNIWKVVATTPVVAGSHYIDEALLKVDGVYATTLKANTRTIAGEEFTHVIQVRTDGYPTQDNLVGKEKSGNTSLVITAKDDIDVTFFYNRQTIDETGEENDNKDLIIFDQAAISTKLTGVFTIAEILEGKSYMNATKMVTLLKDHVYTVTASGTTLQLHGIKFEKYVAPSFYIAGTMTEWATNKIAVKGKSHELSLEAGEHKLKVIVGEGESAQWKGFDALTTVAEGLTADNDNNICFTLAEAGEVNVHYDGEYFFLNGDFYVEPAPAKKYYLKNNWDGAEEWAWKELEYDEDNKDYELIAVFGGKGVNINTAESDEGATWIAAEDITAFDAAYELAELGALDTVVFFFDPEAVNSYTGENGLSALIISKYIAPVPAKFYITGNAALVGDELAWKPNAIRSDEISYKLNLKAGVDYMLKITLDGTWSTVKGFDALTTVANGLTRGTGDNDDNICFKLNNDGEVNVHYDGEYFFLNGDFVVPEPEPVKYFLKNNWDGAEEWAWKEMERIDANDYRLINVVFGGGGVNINTAESDEGAKYIKAEDIVTFDAELNPAELGALDTVAFFFEPESVNSYTGENGLVAQIIGKYIAPVPAKFYITGNAALVGEDLAWQPNAIRSDEVSYKLNLKAGVDYMLKITLDGTWSTVKGFDALTTVANGLTRGTGDNDDNICFKLNADGEVSVHYDGEYFFLNGDFYVEPAPAPKYYLKNNWDGAEEWAWKEMERIDANDYRLINVVFGGKGVNINTAESDEGATWIAAEDILAFDAAYELAELGALDTVAFFFEPEAVNSYTGENGLTALIIGKYVAPVAPELADGFYLIGQKGWDIYALNADLKFAPNGEVEGEYVLNSVVLEVGQELKVVEVKDNAIVTDYWYGSGEGNGNYIVTADVAGTKDIYFRPTWNDGWNGHIYIELNQGTGLENLAVEGKAVKVIKNGELFILRNGKIYTVSGAVVK